MKIYVAGPMTGLPEFNYPLFKRVAEYLRSLGFEVKCPTEIEVHVERGATYKECLNEALALLQSCDTICVLPGWEKSGGARTEIAYGLACGYEFLVADVSDSLITVSKARAIAVYGRIAIDQIGAADF